MLRRLLGSKTRVNVLSALILRPDAELHLRDLVAKTGAAPRSVQVEVDRLVEMGLLRERRSGNRRYLCANTGHRLYPPLRELLERSVGVLPAIEEALGEEPRVGRALVYGSVASGEAGSASDVDLLVIGDVPLRTVVRLLSPVQERLGIEINPVVMRSDEFERRRREGDHFISNVLRSPTVQLIGALDGDA